VPNTYLTFPLTIANELARIFTNLQIYGWESLTKAQRSQRTQREEY